MIGPGVAGRMRSLGAPHADAAAGKLGQGGPLAKASVGIVSQVADEIGDRIAHVVRVELAERAATKGLADKGIERGGGPISALCVGAHDRTSSGNVVARPIQGSGRIARTQSAKDGM